MYDDFCEVNAGYWEDMSAENSGSDRVLVEGFFAESGASYVLRVGIITKALEKKLHLSPLVLLHEGSESEPYKKKIWSSFKFKNFIGVEEDINKHISKAKIKILSFLYHSVVRFLLFIKRIDCIKKLSYKGVTFGDLLYDEIVHNGSIIEKRIGRRNLRQAFHIFFYAEYIVSNYNIKYYVTTHTQYLSYGLPSRYFFSKGITVIETTDDLPIMLYSPEKYACLPKYNAFIKDRISRTFNEVLSNDKLIGEAAEAIKSRICGNSKQIDAYLAYVNKKKYSKSELKKALGISDENPMVFIAAHVFSDAPCGLGEFSLFDDYYNWLDETLKEASAIGNVNWIVKDHPSREAYCEEGITKKIMDRYPGSNIYLCPDDLSTHSVFDTAQAIITCRGTIGIEASCFGIPVIIAADASYSGYGFTIEPKTKKEYFHALKNIHLLKSPDQNQINRALAFFYAHQSSFNKDFSIIDTEVKQLVYGLRRDKDVEGSFSLVAERLKKINPKDTQLYSDIMFVLSSSEKG
jgi:hypothetical protein